MSLGNNEYEMLAMNLVLGSKDPQHLIAFNPTMFQNHDLHNLFKLTRMMYTEVGVVLTHDTLKAELDNRVPNEEKCKFLKGLVDAIAGKDIGGMDSDIIRGKLIEQRRFKTLLEGSEALAEAVAKLNSGEAIASLTQLYESVFAEDMHESFMAADMTMMAGQDIKFNFRKTGFAGLDKRGGLIEGGYTVVAGEAKSGKSTFCQCAAQYNHFTHVGSTAVFTYEQSKSEWRARILSNLSGIDIGTIMNGNLTVDQRKRLLVAEVGLLCHIDEDMVKFVDDNYTLNNVEFWAEFWKRFEPRENRFYILDHKPDWDNLFVQMRLMRDTKGVKFFVIDYPYIIPRGSDGKGLQNWEYNLLMSKRIKQFAGESKNKVWVICPAQYDAKEDSLRYVKGVINDVDLLLKMSVQDGDEEYGDYGAITVDFGAYRNYLSIAGEPTLQPFKLLKQFNTSNFAPLVF